MLLIHAAKQPFGVVSHRALHGLQHMAIEVGSGSNGRMTQVVGNRLEGDSAHQGMGGGGVAQIMEAAFRLTHMCGQSSKAFGEAVNGVGLTCLLAYHQIVVVIAASRTRSLFVLCSLVFFEHCYQSLWQGHGPDSVSFRGTK